MNKSPQNFYRYWGKVGNTADGKPEYHLLPYHCLDVGACAKALLLKRADLLEKLSRLSGFSENQVKSWLTFLYAIHGIGKFGEGFQGQQPELQKLLQDRTSNIP